MHDFLKSFLRIQLLLIVLLISGLVKAQEGDYVVSPTKPYGAYGALSYSVQPLQDGGLEYIPAVSGGFVIDKKWFLGVAFTSVNSVIKYVYQGNNGPISGLESGYMLGNLDFAYTPLAASKAHPIFQLEVGGGDAWIKNAEGKDFTRCNVIALHPKVGLQLSATHWFRMDFMVGYQALFGLNEYFGDKPYNGPVAGINLRFGKFVKD
jgi:hypothetical protein